MRDNDPITREKQRIDIGHNSSGITVSYTKRSRTVHFSGWYDSFVGIHGASIPLADLLTWLEISEKDVRAALKGRG